MNVITEMNMYNLLGCKFFTTGDVSIENLMNIIYLIAKKMSIEQEYIYLFPNIVMKRGHVLQEEFNNASLILTEDCKFYQHRG